MSNELTENTIKGLENYNKWRLGADIEQPAPKEITESIKNAIILLKKTLKNK